MSFQRRAGRTQSHAVYRPAFYGFVLPGPGPADRARRLEGDEVHWYLALVMSVVLAFVLAFGHQLNDVLTRSIAMRYENLDLIEGAARQVARGQRGARIRGSRQSQQEPAAGRREPRPAPAAAAHWALYIAALAARAQEQAWRPLVSSIQRAVAALEGQFEQLLDLSRLEAGALTPTQRACRWHRCSPGSPTSCGRTRITRTSSCASADTRLAVRSDPALLERIVRNLVANAIRYTERGACCSARARFAGDVAIDVVDTGVGIPSALQSAHLRGVLSGARSSNEPRARRARPRPCDRAAPGDAARASQSTSRLASVAARASAS
jgi:signal transduction histidine kinase